MKSFLILTLAWILLVFTCGLPAQSADPPPGGTQPSTAWDVASDTWVATDALGRRVPTHEEVGPPR